MSAQSAAVGSLGELLVEFVCSERDTHNRRATSYRGPFPSGAPAIFIDQAARVGARTIFAGAVGSDAFGTVLLERLHDVGVSDALIQTVDSVPTGSAFVAYNGDESRDFVFNIAQSAAARFPHGELALAAFRGFGTKVLHISGSTLGDPSMASAAVHLVAELYAEGTQISFDPNVRKELLGDAGYRNAVDAILARSTYVLPSEADAAVLFPAETFADFSRRLLAGGAEVVVLKRGERGCIGVSATGERVELAGHRVEMVDPTGAGDCFCGTLVGLLAGGHYGFADAMARANAAGALAVTKIGPMEGNSTLQQIEAFLSERG